MKEAQFSAQQQVDLASLTSTARPENQVSEIQQNDRQQTPSDVGNKEDSDQEVTKDRVTVELTQDRITVVTLASTERMEDAKFSSQSIEGQTETLSVEDHKGVKLKGAVVSHSEIYVHNCLKDFGVANILNISDKANDFNDFYGTQHKLLEAKLKNTETQHKANSMASEMRNTEKRENHLGVVNGQVSDGSGITAIVVESVLSLDKAEIEGAFQDYSEFCGSQCGRKQIKGLPTAVGECNGSLLSCFQFDVQTEYSTEYSNGKLTKEDLVIERSQTREVMNSSSKEPDSSPALIHNQQNSTQREAGKQPSKFNSMEGGGVTWQGNVETDVSPRQISENSNFVEAMRNRHEQPFPLSRFNNQDQPLQDFNSSLKDFPHGQETQSFGINRRDQDYNFQRAHGSEGLPCWMQSSSSAPSIVTSSYSNSHKHVWPVAVQSSPSSRQYNESEFAPDVVKWPGISNTETPSTFASVDTCSQLGSASWSRNLSAHDSLNENRVSRPNSRNDFHDNDFSVRRIRGQEIEALESRELGRDLRYRHYHPHYHFEAERQGRLPIHVSPFTQRIEPDWTAIPKQFSALPYEVVPNARLDLDVVAHRKFIDGGFDKVREILKALEMAKQHIQMSNEPTSSSPELPVQNQSPSQFWLCKK